MTRLSKLPVELHTEILKQALGNHCSGRKPLTRRKRYPRYRRRRSLSIFPFNAALTCRLWRDILAHIPECWTEIAFDLTTDPTPILDAFVWSQTLPDISVLVCTSGIDPVRVDQDQERSRVAAIVDAMEPHIHRCKSIIFDVMYESSLPSSLIFFAQAAPNLEQITIKFRMDGTETKDDNHFYSYNMADLYVPDPNLATSFPRLSYISMEGVAFMELCAFEGAADWLTRLETHHYFRLRVAHFQFPDDEDNHHTPFSVDEFTRCLSRIRSLTKLHLQNLSLEYQYSADLWEHYNCLYDLELCELHFDSVSKDFLSEFYTYGTCHGEKTIYTRCAIPRILQPFYGSSELDRIIADETITEDESTENSFKCVLAGWEGSELTICSCPSFDDDLLQWLGTEVEYTPRDMVEWGLINSDAIVYQSSARTKSLKTFPAESMSTLTIHNCENYSFQKLRWLFGLREDLALAEQTLDPDWDPNIATKEDIRYFKIRGRHPKISEEDIGWINTGNVSSYYPGYLKFLGENGKALDEINFSVSFPSETHYY